MLYITHKLIPFSTVLNFDIGSEDSIDLHSPFFSLYGLKSLNHPLEFPFIFNLGALTSIILLYLICTTKLTSLFFLNTSFSNGKSQSKLQVHVHNNTVHSLPSLLHRFFFFFFTLLHSRDPKSFFFFNHQPYPLPPTPSLLPQEQRLHNFEQTRTTLQEEKNKEKQQEHDDDEAQKEDGQEPTTDTRLITSFLRYAPKGFCPSFWFLTLPQ